MTTAAAGRRLPAEWAPQSGVMLTWPHAGGDWDSLLTPVEAVFARIAAEATRRERLLIAAKDIAHRAHVQQLVTAAGGDPSRIRFHVAPSNDVWARDHAPLSVMTAAGPRLLDFAFNGWGGKYPATHDNRLGRTLYSQGAFGSTPFETIDFVLEGGSIDSDGNGTLLTTSRCLLHRKRNPGLNRAGIEAHLERSLGVECVLWLNHGALAGDDTDGHIDTLARFADAETIIYQSCADRGDANFTELESMKRELQTLRRADGEPYRLVPLPSPRAIHDAAGRRLPAGYANFLILNGAVLVPGYGDAADTAARDAIAACFPGRAVILIDCLPLIHQFGSLHCVTMQFPVGILE